MKSNSGAAGVSSHEFTDVLIIGAGFSGLYALYRLRQQGFSARVIEAASEPGGCWYWNRYPGARVDCFVPNYEFSLEEIWRDWEWTEKYPHRDEIQSYFRHVVERLSLAPDIRFDSRVTSAVFDDDEGLWQVECADGYQARARFLLPCLGFASKPYIPKLPGLDQFKGACVHTAQWPEDLNLAGKRVGVFGTGASGVQTVQEAAKEAAHITVFQRTPNTALPMQQEALDEQSQRKMKQGLREFYRLRGENEGGYHGFIEPDPSKSVLEMSKEERDALFELAWQGGGFNIYLAIPEVMADSEVNRLAYDFWREKVHGRVKDADLAEKLAPKEPLHFFGAKRPSLEQNYYEVFNQENVRLVDLREEHLEAITSTGVRTDKGHHDLDVLVLATGFDAGAGGMTQFEIRGRSGETLRDVWSGGVETYLGIAIPDFPNLLMLYGPHSMGAFCNGPTCIEQQGDWVVDCLVNLRAQGLTQIEATREATDAWGLHMRELLASSLYQSIESSWYIGANIPGKPRQLLYYSGGALQYIGKCRSSSEKGYEGFNRR
jgi:cation diffusion facilitator CzcD-associated flavoprotein CzcO